jgi:DNA (cytosine-5)-methyltransferase 1
MSFTIGSLFSGIGGLELGLELAGVGHTVWQVECDPFCRQVLAKHWPKTERFDDVRNVGKHNLKYVDVICGGFPCQDISFAGKGAGLAGERSGLWSEYLRIVGEIRPRFVVVENVAALRQRGLDVVLGNLTEAGYDAIWFPLRASDVGAPHRRERLFILAYPAELRCDRNPTKSRSIDQGENQGGMQKFERGGALGNPESPWWGWQRAKTCRQGDVGGSSCNTGESRDMPFVEPRLGRAVDGLPRWLDLWPSRPGEEQEDWETPRIVEGKIDNKTHRLKALGNAVVPQVGFVVGKALLHLSSLV